MAGESRREASAAGFRSLCAGCRWLLFSASRRGDAPVALSAADTHNHGGFVMYPNILYLHQQADPIAPSCCDRSEQESRASGRVSPRNTAGPRAAPPSSFFLSAGLASRLVVAAVDKRSESGQRIEARRAVMVQVCLPDSASASAAPLSQQCVVSSFSCSPLQPSPITATVR